MPPGTHQHEELLLTALLAAIALQGLNVLATSALGILPWCWIGALLILAGLAAVKIRLWKTAAAPDRRELTSPWRAPWPWVVLLLLTVQIVAYPPTMSDSLCYRLPRLFLALQDGGIGRFPTEDDRINAMPWGWEFLALPFASLNALNTSKFINLAAWALVFQILFSLARAHGAPAASARRAALALATAPVFLLQAVSTANDLYAAALLLAGVWMIHRFHASPGPVPVIASLLALVLAANAKPQFLVLGLPWLAWWILAPGRPWKQIPWPALAAAAPIFLLLSPLWILFENHRIAGNLVGSLAALDTPAKAPPWIMAPAGLIQLTVAQLQLPVLPASGKITALIHAIPFVDSLRAALPAFHPEVRQLTLTDRASLGLVHLVLLVTGLILAAILTPRHAAPRAWPWIAAFLFGVIVSTTQVVPTTIGRSFAGFFALLLPLAAIGLACRGAGLLPRAACLAAILTGAAALVLNPAAPLWPSKTIQSIAETRGAAGPAAALASYNAYQKRAATGTGILDPVPGGETVGVLVRRITPVSTLWQPDWRARRIEFVNHIDPETFATGPVRWLVVADNAAEFLPDETARYKNLPGWEKVRHHTYHPTLAQGPETWTLHHRTPEDRDR